MKKLFTCCLIVIQNFSLFIGGILAIIFYNCFNINFYQNFYQKEELASVINTSNEELLANTKNLLDYLNGKTSLNSLWFSEKDILHMVDVKNLYDISFKIMIISFCIFILTTIIVIVIERKNTLLSISKIFNKVLIGFILIISMLSGIITYNFNSFWIKFHTALFSNDLWLLSPDESNLIKIVPEEFFISLITTIIIRIFILFIILLIINFIIRRNYKKIKSN